MPPKGFWPETDGGRGLLWEPAIYEHKAALIGRSPAETAGSAGLLTKALLAEHEVYGADLLTVGVDIYNLEVEACGARLTAAGPKECPDIAGSLFDLRRLPRELDLPDVRRAGRFPVMLEAGRRIRDAVGDRASVRIAASGPVSIAARLADSGDLVTSLALQDGNAERLLRFAADLARAWLNAIVEAGLEAVVFDSFAAPPLLSPALYRTAIQPLHREMMEQLSEAGQRSRPLIIGGRTSAIAEALAQAGATFVVCDFTCDAAEFAAALSGWADVTVRRNVRPSAIRGDSDSMSDVVESYCADLRRFPRPACGTGILEYDFAPTDFLRFREAVEKTVKSHKVESTL